MTAFRNHETGGGLYSNCFYTLINIYIYGCMTKAINTLVLPRRTIWNKSRTTSTDRRQIYRSSLCPLISDNCRKPSAQAATLRLKGVADNMLNKLKSNRHVQSMETCTDCRWYRKYNHEFSEFPNTRRIGIVSVCLNRFSMVRSVFLFLRTARVLFEANSRYNTCISFANDQLKITLLRKNRPWWDIYQGEDQTIQSGGDRGAYRSRGGARGRRPETIQETGDRDRSRGYSN